MKKKKDNSEEYKKIIRTVNEYIFENHKVCGLNEITTITKIPRPKCSEIISKLVGQKQLYEIFSGKGMPSLYIPYGMMQEILRLQAKPEWMKKFEHKEKSEILEKVKKRNEEIIKYDMFERLLYTTDKPLEEALAFSLKFLEFDSVRHLLTDDNHDVEFKYKGTLFLIEAKGKEGGGDKDDVLQLRGWVDKKIDEGSKAETLQGVLAVNHYRYEDPNIRSDALTEKAIQYMKMNRFKFFTTYFLFKIIQDVLNNKISKNEAREKIMEGEKYE